MSEHESNTDKVVGAATDAAEQAASDQFGADNVSDAKAIATAVIGVATQAPSITGGQYKDQLKGVVAGAIGDVIGDTKIIVDRDLTSGLPAEFGVDPADPLGIGKDFLDYSEEELELFDKYQEMFDNEKAMLDQASFCNNLFEAFEEQIKLLVDELSAIFDAVVDKLPDKSTNPFAALYQDLKWVFDYVQLKLAMLFDFIGLDLDLSSLEDFFKNIDFGDFEFGDFSGLEDALKQLNLPFDADLKTLAKLGYDTYQFAQMAEMLKNKWGDEDVTIDKILNDPKGFLGELENDIEALCKALPSWEKAKTGKLKVTVKDFNLPEAKIDLKEIIPEGISPEIITIWEKFKELEYKTEKVHEEYISNDKADGTHSNTDA